MNMMLILNGNMTKFAAVVESHDDFTQKRIAEAFDGENTQVMHIKWTDEFPIGYMTNKTRNELQDEYIDLFSDKKEAHDIDVDTALYALEVCVAVNKECMVDIDNKNYKADVKIGWI